MSKTVEKLNLYLVNLNVLYRKVQNYHWNVAGKGFFTIHSKLEEFYDDLNGQIDDVAERILSIGGRPYGTLKDYLELTTIKEAENKDAAKAFVDWALSKEGQEFLKTVAPRMMVRKDVTPPEELKGMTVDKLMKMDIAGMGTRREEILKLWKEKMGK